MAEGTQYKDHTILLIGRRGGVWRVYIRPPDAPMRRAEFPDSLSQDQVVAEARRLVDEWLAARPARRRS
jgi:hypothetical protein